MPRKSNKKKRKAKVVHKVGSHGSIVRVVDRGAGRSLRLEFRYRGKRRRQSLAHRDVDAAKELANQLANKLSEGEAVVPTHKPTAASVVGQYLQAAANKPATKRKARSSQYHERRCARAWIRFLGPDKNLLNLTLGEWEKFWRLRAEGAVDANGDDVPEDERRPVRPRTVAADLKWLKYVIRWATRWKTASGAFLMREDPTKGWEVPSDPNPRQPVATWDRFEKIRAVADQVTMQVIQLDHLVARVRDPVTPQRLQSHQGAGQRAGADPRRAVGRMAKDFEQPVAERLHHRPGQGVDADGVRIVGRWACRGQHFASGLEQLAERDGLRPDLGQMC